jgi:release factor glutamine methyltransferase
MATNNIGGQTVGETLAGLTLRLEGTSDTAGLDAQLLLAHLLERPRSWVFAHPDVPISTAACARLEAITHRLEAGVPLPYILGSWEFFGLQFRVTQDVLIPRPETELLVERAIAWLKDHESGVRGENVLDVGTGSGCIAISLAVNIPGLSITATDISSAALKVAHDNAEKMKVSGNINFLESDLFSNPFLKKSFSMIVTNPPYIPTLSMQQAAVFSREPTMALDGGPDGLAIIRRILSESSERLLAGGLLLMEIEASEGQAVLALASEAWPKARIQLHQDLAGHDRLLEVQK